MASRAIGLGAASRPSGWIMDRPRDLLLVIATPLAIVPLAGLAQLRLSVEEIAMYVAAFGALGHHLPGMMWAYGDRELFERFKIRFTVAPVFLLAVCIAFSITHLNALAVVTLVWGVWHGLAQVYGFARIYDTKAGANSTFTAELDKVLCVAWFGAGIFFSQGRLGNLLEIFYQCGGPVIPAAAIHGFQTFWAWGTGLVTLLFVGNFAARHVRGEPQSFLKPLLMASSFAFWWYSMVGIHNVILGIALFEIFHDVQYLTITWAYNRRLVDKGHGMGPFSRFLFRPKGLMVALYVGLVLLYGVAALVSEKMGESLVQRVLLGAIVASGFLHFYYDGFIWKVRERTIRDGLDLQGGAGPVQPSAGIPGWLIHGSKWSLFVVPLALMATAEGTGLAAPKGVRYQAIVDTLPQDAGFRVKLGIALWGEKRGDEAVAQFEKALALDPDNAEAYLRLGNVQRARGDAPGAIASFQEAIERDGGAQAYNNLGVVYQEQGQLDRAADLFARAAALEPDGDYFSNLGSVRLAQGREGEAKRHYERAIAANPDSAEAHHNLGVLLQGQGQLALAAEHFEHAVRLRPRDPRVRRALLELRAELADRDRRRREIERQIRDSTS